MSEGLGLVERLRKERVVTRWMRGMDTDYPAEWAPNPLCHEAAAELLRLRIAVARAVPAMHSYASKNPKHEMNGALQDPCGVHAWLAEFGGAAGS